MTAGGGPAPDYTLWLRAFSFAAIIILAFFMFLGEVRDRAAVPPVASESWVPKIAFGLYAGADLRRGDLALGAVQSRAMARVTGGPAAVHVTLEQGEPWTGALSFTTVVRKVNPIGHMVVALPVGVRDVSVQRAVKDGADVNNLRLPTFEAAPFEATDDPTAKIFGIPAEPVLPSGRRARVGDAVLTVVNFKWSLPSFSAGYGRHQAQLAFDALDRANASSGGALNLPPLGQFLENSSFKFRDGAFAVFTVQLQQPYSMLPSLSPAVASSFGTTAWATGDGTIGAEYVTFGWEDLRGRSNYATGMRFLYLIVGVIAGAAFGALLGKPGG